MAESTAAPPPKGFALVTSRTGYPAISYRTTGMGCAAFFFVVWLSGWTVGCVFMAYQAFFAKPHIELALALFMIPFWLAEFAVLGFALWQFRSVTVFTFHPDRLVIERTLWRFQRRRELLKAGITALRQIKDGGEGEDSFPSWGLVVEGEKKLKLLSRQKIEKSAWFGPIIATWAGVKYESSEKQNYEEI